MKKIRLIGLVVITLTLLAVGAAAVPALAHPGDSANGAYTGAYLDGPTMVRIAGALGLTPEELSSKLQAGETLAEISQNQNVSEDIVIDAIVAPYTEQLKLQVQYGYLTQEQADTLLQTAREHAGSLLEQDLSGTGGNADWWQEMEDYCGSMMGNYDGSTGYGGMMGGGMMGNYSGGYGGYGGGMMGPGMMGGSYGQGYGPGGMMGPGYGYNDSATGWNAPTPDISRSTSNGWTGMFSRFWNGLTGRGGGSVGGGGMMGSGFGGGMMGSW